MDAKIAAYYRKPGYGKEYCARKNHTPDLFGNARFGVFASHYNSIGRQIKVITRLYDELFDWLAREHGIDQWVTFSEALPLLTVEGLRI